MDRIKIGTELCDGFGVQMLLTGSLSPILGIVVYSSGERKGVAYSSVPLRDGHCTLEALQRALPNGLVIRPKDIVKDRVYKRGTKVRVRAGESVEGNYFLVQVGKNLFTLINTKNFNRLFDEPLKVSSCSDTITSRELEEYLKPDYTFEVLEK